MGLKLSLTVMVMSDPPTLGHDFIAQVSHRPILRVSDKMAFGQLTYPETDTPDLTLFATTTGSHPLMDILVEGFGGVIIVAAPTIEGSLSNAITQLHTLTMLNEPPPIVVAIPSTAQTDVEAHIRQAIPDSDTSLPILFYDSTQPDTARNILLTVLNQAASNT